MDNKIKKTIKYFEKELQKSEVELFNAKTLYDEYEKIAIQNQAAKDFENLFEEVDIERDPTSLTNMIDNNKKHRHPIFEIPSERNRRLIDRRITELKNVSKVYEQLNKGVPARVNFVKKLIMDSKE